MSANQSRAQTKKKLRGLLVIAFSFFSVPLDAAFLRTAPNEVSIASALLNTSSMQVQSLDSMFFSAESSVEKQAESAAESPNIFVAVMTTRATATAKRNAIRALWSQVDGGKGNICSRFVVCKANDQQELNLLSEQSTYGDILTLDCEEGYAKGLLTKKVLAVMQAYRNALTTNQDLAYPMQDSCLNRSLFMKMDDDTFVAGHRFRAGVSKIVKTVGPEFMYAGVDLPGNHPERNESSPWYEPLSVWSHENYAPAMYGGPGYILGRSLVRHIIDDKIAENNILWNEDRAVGVWVNTLEQRGVKVTWVRVPGTNGFEWDHPVKKGSWGMYPYTLHHHLSFACIECLTKLDKQSDQNLLVDECFKLDPSFREAKFR